MAGKGKPPDPLILSLDVADPAEARRIVCDLSPSISTFKIGPILYTAAGPDIVPFVREQGARVFLDLKFHDIPSTVSRTIAHLHASGISMFTVHCSGGLKMLTEAVKAARAAGNRTAPLVLGVTVLTSLDTTALRGQLGIPAAMTEQVLRLAKLARRAGLDGVVASPKEIRPLREAIGDDLLIVTPGIRPSWSPLHDQKRVMTPQGAILAGADYIVIGRPILEHKDPPAACRRIRQEIEIAQGKEC